MEKICEIRGFTCENEINNSWSFLDVQVVKSCRSFETSTHYKPTHTGLGLNFNSSISNIYKNGLIKCLVDRAYKINSSYDKFLTEINDLKVHFLKNCYPLRVVNQIIDTTFTSIVEPKEVSATAPKEKVFVKPKLCSVYLYSYNCNCIICVVIYIAL